MKYPLLSRRLLELRAARGLNRYSLAREVGVHHAQVQRWEEGRSFPAQATVMRLAQVLEVDPVSLLACALADAAGVSA
jgi:transcriptional regulator with XRE-family HTH domain